MIIKVDRKQLLTALRKVIPAAAKTDTSGIHPEAVLISAGMGNLRLACIRNASNFAFSIITNVVAEMDPEELGQFAVTARLFLKLLRLCGSEFITLEITDKFHLTIRDGKNAFHLMAIDAQNVFANIVHDRECTISAPGLLKAAQRVWFAASTEEARPALQGIMFNGKVAATDGFRIAVWPVGFESVHGLIPAKVLQIAGRIFRGVDPLIWLDGERIAFSDGTTTIETSQILLNTNFPDVDVIIPKKAKLLVEFDTAKLAQALNMLCAIVERFEHPVMTMTVDQTGATLHKKGEAEILFDAEIDAQVIANEGVQLPFKIAFNPVLLLDLVKRAGPRVVMHANAHNTPVVWKPAGQEDPWLSVLMPMHIG